MLLKNALYCTSEKGKKEVGNIRKGKHKEK